MRILRRRNQPLPSRDAPRPAHPRRARVGALSEGTASTAHRSPPAGDAHACGAGGAVRRFTRGRLAAVGRNGSRRIDRPCGRNGGTAVLPRQRGGVRAGGTHLGSGFRAVRTRAGEHRENESEHQPQEGRSNGPAAFGGRAPVQIVGRHRRSMLRADALLPDAGGARGRDLERVGRGRADRGASGFRRDLHIRPLPQRDGQPGAWVVRRVDEPGRPCRRHVHDPPGHLGIPGHVPPTRGSREVRRHGRSDQSRSCRGRHGGRMVGTGASDPRLPLSAGARALRATGGAARDRPSAHDGGSVHVRREALPARRRSVRAEGSPGAAPADHRRRWVGAQARPARVTVGRRVQHGRGTAGVGARTLPADPRATRRRRPRPGNAHDLADDLVLRRRHPCRGDGSHRARARTSHASREPRPRTRRAGARVHRRIGGAGGGALERVCGRRRPADHAEPRALR